MKVMISTIARFHAFSLAEQLQKQKHLHKLIVGYFNREKNAKGYDIDKNKVVRNIIPIVIGHLPNRVLILRRWRFQAQYLTCELHDLWARAKLEPCHIFVGWSSFSLHTLRKAKALGAVTIVERGSAHMLAQKEILEREYAEFGIPKKVVSEKVLEKELHEYEESDYISIPSTFARRTFLEKGVPEEKLIQIPYGVSLEHFRPVPKEDDVFRVMHIGGNLQKGTHLLLQAMSELNLKNAELMIIGRIEEPVRPLFQRYKGTLKIFPGFPHTELYKHFSQGSVYVLPSIQEGMAMVQAEAMACGLPLICSTNTGGEDLIRDGIDGFVVPVRDVEALKEKILYLYEHENERREMGRNALQRVKEFTWDRYGERVVEAYRRTLKLRGR
jgi:glycosyltransferase involved in cell wall biosynthesis